MILKKIVQSILLSVAMKLLWWVSLGFVSLSWLTRRLKIFVEQQEKQQKLNDSY
jgi:hypothetical protein